LVRSAAAYVWVLRVLERRDVTPLARPGAGLVDVTQEPAVVLVLRVAPELLLGIEDRHDVEDQRPAGVEVLVVRALSPARETTAPFREMRKWPSSSREWPANWGPAPKNDHVAFGSFHALRAYTWPAPPNR
jgi:hypothetical protein